MPQPGSRHPLAPIPPTTSGNTLGSMNPAPSDEPHRPEVSAAVGEVEQQLGALFARARAGWRAAATSVHPGLQPLGYQVLALLVNGRADSAGAIVEALQVDKSVVSRQIRMLEEYGLVESHPDPADGRARVLQPTPLAIERVAQARSAYRTRLATALDDSSPDELRQFADMLHKLTI